MSNVISLTEFREQKTLESLPGISSHFSPDTAPGGRPPHVTDAHIWGRNYTNFNDVVFGILKIREILDYHLHFSEEWKYYVLCLLEHSYFHKEEPHKDLLLDTIALMKTYISEELNVINRQDLSIALIILDLIEKAWDTRKSQHH